MGTSISCRITENGKVVSIFTYLPIRDISINYEDYGECIPIEECKKLDYFSGQKLTDADIKNMLHELEKKKSIIKKKLVELRKEAVDAKSRDVYEAITDAIEEKEEYIYGDVGLNAEIEIIKKLDNILNYESQLKDTSNYKADYALEIYKG